MKYKAYTHFNYHKLPQVEKFTQHQRNIIDTVSNVFPFKTNNYVVNELIDWDNFEDDPMFVLNFPQKGMLLPEDFGRMEDLIRNQADKKELFSESNSIRMKLNPHPAGQMDHNVPSLNGEKLLGIQHKYRETMLFFPTQGQTCHAYCTFCFRWLQFTGMDDLKFAMKQADLLVQYLEKNPSITDLLITGGDPMIMNTNHLERYIDPILDSGKHNVTTIRIGTKSLSFWPYRYLTDKDSEDLLRLFEKITRKGFHLALMAHFNHPRELSTPAVEKAVKRIRKTGAQIRTQSPLLNHINNDPNLWARMWKKQVSMGIIPYYMFIARDTGAQHFFGVSLNRSWNVFRKAYNQVSGIARTVRGPSMSADPGKVQILGVSEVKNEKVFVLNFLQGRNPDWVGRPFFARFDEHALWLSDLQPAFLEDNFFYEDEFNEMKANLGQRRLSFKEYRTTA